MSSPTPAMETPARPILARTEATESPPALTDELLEEIFLHIASPADLARASTACVSFRRLIADRNFLRRYRSLHPPLLLGLVCGARGPRDIQPPEAPHPSARVAHVLASAGSFSFDYLPPASWHRWEPLDVRGGRILLMSDPGGYEGLIDLVHSDLAVCDPVFQRYLLLPPIPDDLLASVQLLDQKPWWFVPLLVPSGDDENETSFRVIGVANGTSKAVVIVYSSGSGCWSVGSSTSWDDPGLHLEPWHLSEYHHYANGCFFWRLGIGNKLLKLVMNTMEFYTIDLPPGHNKPDIVIVEAGEGRLGVFSQVSPGTVCSYTMMQNDGERGNEWKMQSMISLPSHYIFDIKGAAEGYIFLLGRTNVRDTVCFSLEIKTSKIERVSRICDSHYDFYPYFGFPPSLSPKRI
ncbi:hypothetical protein ACP70R_005649 [Stipagrostis hirtigluma subsp. patula]